MLVVILYLLTLNKVVVLQFLWIWDFAGKLFTKREKALPTIGAAHSSCSQIFPETPAADISLNCHVLGVEEHFLGSWMMSENITAETLLMV